MIIFKIKGHLGGKTKMAVDGHIEFLTFDRKALEYLIFDQFECTDSIGIVIITIHGYPGVKTKWLPSGHLEILCFDIIALESHVIPFFD